MGVRKDGITLVDDVGSSGAVPVDATIVAPLPLPVEIDAPLGANVVADSVSVTIATNQPAVPVSISAPITIVDPILVDQNEPNADVAKAWPIKVTDGVDTAAVVSNADGTASPKGLLVAGADASAGIQYLLPILAANYAAPTTNTFAVAADLRSVTAIDNSALARNEVLMVGGVGSNQAGSLTNQKIVLTDGNTLDANPVNTFGVQTKETGHSFAKSGNISAVGQRFTISSRFVVKTAAIFKLVSNGFLGTLRPVVSLDNGANWSFCAAINIETLESATSFVDGAVTGTYAIPFGNGATDYGFEITVRTAGDITCSVSANSNGVNAIFSLVKALSFALDSVDVSGSVIDTELPPATLLADNTANPTVPAVASYGMVFDGSTWDRIRGTSVDGLLVNLGDNNNVIATPAADIAGSQDSINALNDFVTLGTSLIPDGYNLVKFDLSVGSAFLGTLDFYYSGVGVSQVHVYDVTAGKWVNSITDIPASNSKSYLVPVAPGLSILIYCSAYTSGTVTVRDILASLTALVGAPLTNVELRETPLSVNTKTDLTPSAPTVASVGVASAQAVAAAAARKGLTLRNLSNARISLGFGAAAVLDSGVTLYPRDAFSMEEYDFDLGAVNAIASAAASSLAIQEYLT